MRHHHHFHSHLQEINPMKRKQLDFKASNTNDFNSQTNETMFETLS